MKQCKFYSMSVLLFLFLCTFYSIQAQENQDIPRQVLLTWQGNTSETMTITWRTDQAIDNPTLRYTHKAKRDFSKWNQVNASSFTFEPSKAHMHTVELKGLKAGRDYHVVIDHPTQPDQFYFTTIPKNNRRNDLIFLAGGDSRSRRDVRREMNELAIRQNPDFVVFDGDFIATALNEEQWDDWFDDWHEQMITPEGRRIPVVPAIGNHEVQGGYGQTRDKAAFYFNRFIVPEPRNFYALEFTRDLILITLDTEHITPVEDQTDWLDSTLSAHSDKKWKIIQWHVAAWPSVRDFEGDLPRKIRETWIPVIEKHNVDFVIEAHDHAYKRTEPIRNDQIDLFNGIYYLGDGGWGAPVRDTKNPEEYWWLAEAEKADHLWKYSISNKGNSITVVPVFKSGQEGSIILKNK
ncbi:MAG: metallophosphoesterase family protein [Cyclobacteriaceae bacterium]|nr:metallophosphoesterase family protein [Cyclobacteriaceae bacterium]